MAQFQIYPNPGIKRAEIPFFVAVQNGRISSRTGATVVIPLRADVQPVEVMAPCVNVEGHGQFVLSADEIFTIDNTRLKNPVGVLDPIDRAKIRPAMDKVLGDY